MPETGPGQGSTGPWLTPEMEWDEKTYGEAVAGLYDDLYENLLDKASAVQFLAEKAEGRRALELAIGTGRIALPLRNAGVDLHGIDISEAMVAKLREKPGGREIPVTMGNFADVAIPGEFQLIYLVFNTIFALTTQEEQLRCFANVADHLTETGVFVVEAFVPDPARFERHQNTEVSNVEVDRVLVTFSRTDPAMQTVASQHLMITEQSMKMVPVAIRYIWPSEMDLMAKLAGMELRERYGSWTRDPFTSSSGAHISVYGRA